MSFQSKGAATVDTRAGVSDAYVLISMFATCYLLGSSPCDCFWYSALGSCLHILLLGMSTMMACS